jgi:hypothetical protein
MPTAAEQAMGYANMAMTRGKRVHTIIMAVAGICTVIVIAVLAWTWSKLTLKSRNCRTLYALYKKTPPGFTSVDADGELGCHALREFYVKTAYNCCATGEYKNDFVSLCALEDCIRQGVRCLDFEIYSVDDKPVVSVSAIDDFHVKGSYNSIPFADTMKTIQRRAFGGQSNCPNPQDPLIIYLRIMSNNRAIYKQMADDLYGTLEDRLLGKQYSYENHGLNLGSVQLKKLMGKVIVAVDKTNAILEGSPLDEYVNIATRGPFMRVSRYHDVKNAPSADELIEFNKKNMSVCLPDTGASPDNRSASLPMAYGCQFVAMAYQDFNQPLEHYESIFAKAGAAFVMKPANLRFVPVYQKNPPPQNPKLSYQTRHIEAAYQAPMPI